MRILKTPSRQRRAQDCSVAPPQPTATSTGDFTCTIQRRKRFWEVRDPHGDLVCITVYRCGAREVARRLTAQIPRVNGPPSS
jgi:hypothetical protein